MAKHKPAPKPQASAPARQPPIIASNPLRFFEEGYLDVPMRRLLETQQWARQMAQRTFDHDKRLIWFYHEKIPRRKLSSVVECIEGIAAAYNEAIVREYPNVAQEHRIVVVNVPGKLSIRVPASISAPLSQAA